jgi:hypothetical protein
VGREVPEGVSGRVRECPSFRLEPAAELFGIDDGRSRPRRRTRV